MNLLHPGVRVGHTDPQSSSVTLPPHGSHSVAGGSLVPAFGGRGRPDLHLVGWGPGDGPDGSTPTSWATRPLPHDGPRPDEDVRLREQGDESGAMNR